MNDKRGVEGGHGTTSTKPLPTWWIVLARELRELWIGGKALHLILIYTVLLGIYSYLLASNAEVNLMPLKEMVLEMVKASIAVGLFISLIIGADSFSGERERATLENLLLTPASRRQIVTGKFLAAVSPWPAALAIAIPYWVVLSKGDAVFHQAVVWAVLLGSLLAPALAGLGMLVSIWCNTNKSSMLLSICIYLLLLLPTELMTGPAKVQRTAEQWFRAELNQWVNPLAATSRFLWKVLVNQESPTGLWFWHVMPALFTAVILLILFAYAGPRLRLDAGAFRVLRYWDRLCRVTKLPGSQPGLRKAAGEPESNSIQDVFPQPTLETPRMSDRRSAIGSREQLLGSGSATWWLVFKKELRDLWVGGRALYLTLLYTLMLAIYAYLMARDSVLSLIPPQEMVFELLKAAIVASVFVGVIIGADSLSGERERATLEGLLLTPVSRKQVLVGKFLAAVSPWLVALAIAIPYLKVLSQGDEVFGKAVLWGAVTGSVLTPAFSALGMFVSFWCNSNKTSLFVGLCIYLFFQLPTQLPAHAQGGAMGLFFQWVNPLGAPRVFLASMLVNNWTLERAWTWLLSPIVFAVLVFWLLFFYAGPKLRLEAGRAVRFRQPWGRAAVLAIAGCLAGILGASPAVAQETATPQEQPAVKRPEQLPLQIAIDMDAKVVRAGTPVLYQTTVTNSGATATPPLIVAMNIVNLNAQGEIVDPEDWSPQRTQYVESLSPSQSVTHSWRVNAILDGDYMIYMVLIPAPGSVETTSQPVASAGIHLTVTPFTRLNPGGVIPYAIGGPILVALVIFLIHRHRRRSIDAGGTE